MTPEATGVITFKPPKNNGPPTYRELVRGFQYLVSGSRPDITHAVRNLGKLLNCFDHLHYQLGMRVLRYLQRIIDYGLVMDVLRSNSVHLHCYADASYTRDEDDRKCISGYTTMIDNNVVSYASQKHTIVAQVTTKAEYVAVAEGYKDLLWHKHLREELHWKHDKPLMLDDNIGSIYLSKKPGKHIKTTHIEA